MEEDFAVQMKSGPHILTPEMRQKHRELQTILKGDLPIRDPFRKSDCDMLYRYLIARKWDVGLAAEAVRENNVWREANSINTVLTERCEDWGDMPEFIGVDREGYPIQYNAPNSQVLVDLLKSKPKDVLVRRHFIAMERARYLCKKHNAERTSCVVDLTNVGMTGITQAIAFLKEMGTYDQKYYPETMRRMIVCNGGWAITGAWKGIKNFIDPRTQQKISFVSGPPSAKVLSEFIHPTQIPKKYGGTGDEAALTFDFSQLWGKSPSNLLIPTVSPKVNLPVPETPVPGRTAVSEPSHPVTASDSNQVPPSGAMKGPSGKATSRPAPVVTGNDLSSAASAVVFESPRMPDDMSLAEAAMASPSAAIRENDSDEDTFYSMPSTDDERDDVSALEPLSEASPQSNPQNAMRRSTHSVTSPMSPSIIIHAANLCDQAIIDAERRSSARRTNPAFHLNPSSAAIEGSVAEHPRSFPNHSSNPNLGQLRTTEENAPQVLSMPIGRQPTVPSKSASPTGAYFGSISAAAPSPASALSHSSVSLSFASPMSPTAEMLMYRKLATDAAPFTITIGFCDGCFTASVGGVVLGRKMENVIMSGEADTLLMTMQREAGHPVHIHHMLVTPRRQVRYVMRKGRVKDEIKVFDVHGDRTVTSVKDKGRLDGGEKVEKYTITQWPHTKDPRDWLVWRKGLRQGEEFFMWKQGREVEVTAKMLLDGNTPETIVAMVLALSTLWYSPCTEY